MGFPQNVATRALVACGRCCCICHNFCGTKIELHHIKQKAYGGEDTFENCIPLCFSCHADMGKGDPKHPKGKRYTEEELRGHRDRWYAKVEKSTTETMETVYPDDIKLFHEICNVFDDHMKYWLHEADLSGLQPSEIFKPLSHLLEDSEDPFFEFLNIELEKEKATLFSAIKEFIYFNVKNTFPVSYLPDKNAPRIWLYHKGEMNYGLLRQNPEYQGNLENAEKAFEKESEKLNDLATAVWTAYCEFVQVGRKILSYKLR